MLLHDASAPRLGGLRVADVEADDSALPPVATMASASLAGRRLALDVVDDHGGAAPWPGRRRLRVRCRGSHR